MISWFLRCGIKGKGLHDRDLDPGKFLQEELAINPFLRPDAHALKKFTGLSDPRTVLAAVRKAKDQF